MVAVGVFCGHARTGTMAKTKANKDFMISLIEILTLTSMAKFRSEVSRNLSPRVLRTRAGSNLDEFHCPSGPLTVRVSQYRLTGCSHHQAAEESNAQKYRRLVVIGTLAGRTASRLPALGTGREERSPARTQIQGRRYGSGLHAAGPESQPRQTERFSWQKERSSRLYCLRLYRWLNTGNEGLPAEFAEAGSRRHPGSGR